VTIISTWSRTASPIGNRFNHHLFAHGRLFYRYHGSEAARFSPAGAFRLLARLTRDLQGEVTLWDPFCGTGFIPCMAAAFFAHRFRVLVASDILRQAPACALANLALFIDQSAQARRLDELDRNMRPSPRDRQRWGPVRDYLAQLLLPGAAQPQAVHAFQASAMATPQVLDHRLLLIGDLPYGRASQLQDAPDYRACLTPLLTRHPHAHALWIAPLACAEMFSALGADLGRAVRIERFQGGRLQARFAPLGMPFADAEPTATEAGGLAAGDRADADAVIDADADLHAYAAATS
jgi:hypothetical protein